MVLGKIKNLRGLLYKKIKKASEKKEELILPGFAIKKPRGMIEFPEITDTTKVNITYPILEPFAYVNIKWDEKTKELVYNVIEPELTEEDKEIIKRISEGLIELVEVELASIKTTSKAIEYLEKNVTKVIREYGITLTENQYVKIMYYIYRNFVGFNEIEVFLQDPNIEDISCDGTGTPLYIIHRKFGSLRTNVVFEDLEKLREFVIKLAERCGRYVSYAEPILAGTLADGSRVSATLAGDVATRGPVFTIRKFTEKPISPTEQIDLGTASPELLAYFWYLLEHGASMLIVGGVATGKCIAPNDFIQLGNGEVRPIKEVFDEVVGENPGPKVELVTLTENLKLASKRVNKFWKLRPQGILVDVTTSSGCKVTTTPEHEFLCLRNSELQKIRSDELKSMDYVASPRKIDIEGEEQKIHLVDFANEKVYISGPKELVEKILSDAKEKNNGIKNLAKSMNLNYERVRGWFNGNSIPFPIFREICKHLNYRVEDFEDRLEIKSKTGSKGIRSINKTSGNLLKLVGYVIGDGGIYEDGIQFFNESKALREDFIALAKGFGLLPRKDFSKSRTPKIVLQNKVFELLLRKIFEIPKGSKPRKVNIPNIIMRCSRKEIREFVKALFDSKGSVSKKKCEIEFSTSSEFLAYKLSSLFRRFGIVVRIREKKIGHKTYYRVVISGKRDLEKYKKLFSFTDKKNIKKLDEIIKRAGNYHNDIDIVPVGFLLKRIIKKNKLTVSEVARKAKISRESLRDIVHIKTNPSMRMLKKIISSLEGLVREDLADFDTLKLIANSDIFWDRIEEIKKRNSNEEYVYDFTVDGTHNFVAGNGGGLIVSNTSFLNTLCMFIPPEAKIVSIEDTRELKIPNEHWVPNLARVGFGIPTPAGEKYGEVTLFDLLKESFRQNPDYVIVGEVRGSETYVMFQGMSSGHPCLSTFHAGSIPTVIKRLITPPIELSPALLESLDVISVMVHAREKGKAARRMKEVVEIESVDPKTEEVKTRTIFKWDAVTDTYEKVGESVKIPQIVAKRGGKLEDALSELKRRERILKWFMQKNIKDYLEVTRLINLYYKEPQKLMDMMGEAIEPVPIRLEAKTRIPKIPEKVEKPKRRVSILDLLGFKLIKEK